MNYLKFLKASYILLLPLFFVACEKEAEAPKNILWVNKEKVTCMGFIEQSCYQVQEGEELGTDWLFFSNTIDGFDTQYEEGFIYQLEVLIETIDNPPADASSLKYTLVKIISKA